MGKIRDIISKLQRDGSKEALEKSLLSIVKANQAGVIDLNLSQLSEGKDSDGKEIQPPYSPLTVMIKKSKGQPTDRVTLRDEGDFYSKFTLESQKFPITLDSKDLKTPKLTEKYGSEIFGLTEKSKDELVQEIKPEVQDYYHSLIHV
jgi:hypothetical protein